jgi:hypothetical protein
MSNAEILVAFMKPAVLAIAQVIDSWLLEPRND